MITELTYFEETSSGVFKAREGKGLHDDTVSSGYWVSYALRQRYFTDDFMWYAGKHVNSATQDDTESAADEDILNTFNKYVKPMSDKDMFRQSLGR